MATYHQALEALGDGTRRTIMELLHERPRPVGELARELPISQPAVSQHLKVLKGAGLVTDRAHGTRRVYEVAPQGLADVQAYLETFWDRALARLKDAAETEGVER